MERDVMRKSRRLPGLIALATFLAALCFPASSLADPTVALISL
jgi:hypothetical protein